MYKNEYARAFSISLSVSPRLTHVREASALETNVLRAENNYIQIRCERVEIFAVSLIRIKKEEDLNYAE